MLLTKRFTLLATGTLFLSVGANAAVDLTNQHEQLIVTQCLKQHISANYTELKNNKKYSLIDVAAADVESIAIEASKFNCGKFINVTSSLAQAKQLNSVFTQYTTTPKTLSASGYKIEHDQAVNALLPQVNSDNIWQTLNHLTSYYNRSAYSDTGVQTAYWLKDQFDKMAQANQRSDVKSYLVETGYYYKQPSVVTVIGKDINADAIVLGAHMDTLSGNMPGAGDDGSGSSSLMEVARVLLSSKQALKRPVYLIWYSAEERGLVGSQYVVKDFKAKKIPVKTAIQFDMTGFRNNASDQTMWVFTDYTSSTLNAFVADLIKHYVKVPVDYSYCGYGCSDHASWMAAGVPASFPCETDFPHHNPNIHTSNDRKEYLSLEHMTNFAKLGVAFAVELAS